MKTPTFLLSAAFLVSGFSSPALTNTAIAVSGTNVLLSWPSHGYESYLVQYRQTLSETDSWSSLTNAYPANSTNRTTLAISPNLPTGIFIPGTNGDVSIDPNGTNTSSFGGTNTLQPGTGFFRVFHIPDWLVSFSGYTFDGPTFIPVDFAAPDAPTNLVEYTTLLLNGQPTDDADFILDNIGGTTYGGMGIYFDRFPNGTNTIQLLATVRQSDVINDQTPYMVFSNAPQTVVISNFVTYTNWSSLILSNTYTFNAQSATTNVDWEIDIYDVNDNFVNYQTGHSDDGNISWTWDLTDYNGDSRLDDGDPFFYPYITIGDPTSGWTPPIANQFPSVGDWLFTYMDNFYDDGTTNYAGADAYYNSAISTMGGGPALWSIGFLDIPLKYGRVYDQTNRDASWDNLRSWLESWNNRNLYYFGHGAAGAIGGDYNTLDSNNNITGSTDSSSTSKAHLTSQWSHDNVTFNKTWGPMPFRFVFLDGCNTANGNWPAAWGVPGQVEPLSYYQSSSNTTGARPSAFVGWDVEIGGSKDWGTVQNFWKFRSFWMGNWSVQAGQLNDGLRDVFDQALAGSNWVDSGHYAHMKIFGYQDMTFLQYNHAGDWPQ